MEAIRIDDLSKTYKETTAVEHLTLSIEKGEIFSLLGVNGAGKTTTIKMLSGLTKPTSGNAFLNGKSILHDIQDIKRIIGVSPQETAIAPGLTVKENLALICGIHGLSSTQTNERIKELLELFHLEQVSKRKAGKLSGGWQRRLSLAIALVNKPDILFLDEPTLGLDVIARSELWDIIRSLKGMATIILTTHYMEEAESLSDRVAIMKEGKLIVCAAPNEIKKQTQCDRFEEAFIRIIKGGVQ